MGKDIHFAFQKKQKGDEHWKNLDFKNDDQDKLYDSSSVLMDRHHDLWDFLDEYFDVGCPEALKNTRLYFSPIYEYYLWDTTGENNGLFGFGYATLEEVKRAVKDFNESFNIGVWVSDSFVDEFLALGGQLPEGMLFSDVKIIPDTEKYLADSLDEFVGVLTKIAKKFNQADDELRVCWCFDW